MQYCWKQFVECDFNKNSSSR